MKAGITKLMQPTQETARLISPVRHIEMEYDLDFMLQLCDELGLSSKRES